MLTQAQGPSIGVPHFVREREASRCVGSVPAFQSALGVPDEIKPRELPGPPLPPPPQSLTPRVY